jgi:hypothetical protein
MFRYGLRRIAYHDRVTPVRASAAVVVACLALAPLLPAQHVHEADHHGHGRVAHQHLSPHHVAAPEAPGQHVESDDEPILTLTSVYTVPPPQGAVAPPVDVVALLAQPPIAIVRRHTQYVEPVIHGPPRAPTSLRAPPFTPAV